MKNTTLFKTKWFCIEAEIKNQLYRDGYRYYMQFNYHETDRWDRDCYCVECDTFLTDDKEEAEKKRIEEEKNHPLYNWNLEIEEIPEHTETWKEFYVRDAERRAENLEKKHAREARKAAELGLTIGQYKNLKTIKKIEREIEELEKEIERKKAKIEYYMAKE